MARLAPNSLALTALLGLLTAMGPLSTDLYLPSLPSIARHFGVGPGEAQLTLSFFLLGFALGLPIYGPVADRIGRKPVLIFGLSLFALANALAAAAPSLDILIACRFLQGFAAGASATLGRAIARDLYEGRRAAQQLARMGAIMAVVPAIAPLIGVVLELSFGWRSNFVFCVIFVLALGIAVHVKLPETLRQPLAEPLSFRAIFGGFADLLRDARFLPFAFLAAATYSGLFAFISGSSFLYQSHFGSGVAGFAIAFSLVVLGFMAGSFIAQKLALRHSQRRLLAVGALLQAGAGAAMLASAWLQPTLSWGITVPMLAYTAGVGFTLPQAMAGAMMPFPERAGSVSSLLAIVQMAVAAIVGALVGAYIARGPLTLALAVFLCGAAALALQPALGGRRAG